ncbi:MAG: hypothetical protein QXG00_00015 [Candidatus Woesearchaeota archaeon]
MKPIYYFFGISKNNCQFTISDPIMIREGQIFEFYSDQSKEIFEFKYRHLENILEIFVMIRSVGYGYDKNKNRIDKFISFGKLLIPEVQKNETSVYFLDHENCLLFKINKRLQKIKEIKTQIWKWIKNLKICTKKEFEKNLKKLDQDNDEISGYYICSFSSGTKISVAVLYSLFFCIYKDNYYDLKFRANKLWFKYSQRKSDIFLR